MIDERRQAQLMTDIFFFSTPVLISASGKWLPGRIAPVE
jgi:hypothetical protein